MYNLNKIWLLAVFSILTTAIGKGQPKIRFAVLEPDRKILNPVLTPGDNSLLSVWLVAANGQRLKPKGFTITYSAANKLCSGDSEVLAIRGNRAFAKQGGMATVSALITNGKQTFKAATDIVVRPYYREYHQALVLKLFMGMEGEPVERVAKEPLFLKKHDVLCTFEQALELFRKVDAITLGIPKIVYLVGWQKGGHDHQYPSWATVNPLMKRSQDSTALQSLRWLIREARQFHTTVSLHVNMVDAYKSSPLWNEYVKRDIIARDTNGRLLASNIAIKGDSIYNISYTREWQEGLAQKRIDDLIEMVPELKEGHTIHVDVFLAKTEHHATISPWHAMPEHGGIDIYKEVATQRKIFMYWRERGFDVTGEGLFWAHPPGEGYYGLQPMTWWYPSDISYQMQTPEYLSSRGMTNRDGDGDFRFGSSMHGEDLFQNNLDSLSGFLQQFCRTTLPWYYLSRNERLALVHDTLFYSNGIKAYSANGHNLVVQNDFVLRDNNDLFVPALWHNKSIIAYSENGYANRLWTLPQDWRGTTQVDIYTVTLEGPIIFRKAVAITNGRLNISVPKETAVCIVPASQTNL